MLKLTSFKFYLSLFLLAVISFTASPSVGAVSAADWKAGRIIDDAYFYKPSDLSIQDIQQFLNAKVSSCDTNGSAGPYYDKNGTRWNTRGDYGRAAGSPPPYTCLKDYSVYSSGKTADSFCQAIPAGSKSAAVTIYEVSNACGISSKALIVMLEKEQGLVSDDWPWPIQYRGAMGYGCPDKAPCDAEYYGAFNQVYNAARQFKRYATYPDEYRNKPYANKIIQWHPDFDSGRRDASGAVIWEDRCGGANVYIENKATAGLYNYTPFQPNSAALQNMYGTGDGCSAYGNRNFWRIHNDWFGPTLKPTVAAERFFARWNELGGATGKLGKPLEGEYCGIKDGGCYQKFETGYMLWSSNTGAWENIGAIRNRWVQLGAENGQLGFPIGGESCTATGCIQTYQGGRMVWGKNTGAWENIGAIRNRWVQLGEAQGKLGYPIEGEHCGIKNGGCYQKFERGYMIWSSSTNAWENIGAIRNRWVQLGAENGTLGYPVDEEKCVDGGCYQKFERGYVIWSSSTGAWEHSAVLNSRWQQTGGGQGRLNYPVENEKCGIKDGGCYQKFKRGFIVWSSSTGAWAIYDAIHAKWMQLGAENGALGYPTAAEACTATSCSQSFEGGTILWDATHGARMQP